MTITCAADMQAHTVRAGRNCSWTTGAHVVRCIFNSKTRTCRFEIDNFLVPHESVDALLIQHAKQRPELMRRSGDGRY